MTAITLRGITERDLDLLFVEELVASGEFREWFATQIGLPSQQNLDSVARSVITSTGESDLEITYRAGATRTRLLVENKIDAVMQPRQSERYAERAAQYLADRECEQVATVFIAPQAYAALGKGFDHSIAYETVRTWLANEASGDARSQYKLCVIDAAILRGESGWTLVPDEAATTFWRQYWELATAVAPELRMPKPGVKPATSSFLRFRPHELPKGVALLHKLPYGNVDLQFAGQADHIETFSAEYKRVLGPGMSIAPANKSLVVRMVVREVALEAPFRER